MIDIELSEDEKAAIIADAIKKATDKKRIEVEERNRREREDAYAKQMLTPWTAEQYLSYIKKRSTTIFKRPLDIDKDNEAVIKQLCLYFANDNRFEKNGLSLDKGIILQGPYGTGKSYILKLFSINQRRSFKVTTARLICDMYEDVGNDVLYEYSSPQYFIPTRLASFNQKEFGRLYDDVGAENTERNKFGGRLTAMREVLSNIYEKETPYWWYHLTMNLTKKQFSDVYGERVGSRANEMFNFIELKGKDRRSA